MSKSFLFVCSLLFCQILSGASSPAQRKDNSASLAIAALFAAHAAKNGRAQKEMGSNAAAVPPLRRAVEANPEERILADTWCAANIAQVIHQGRYAAYVHNKDLLSVDERLHQLSVMREREGYISFVSKSTLETAFDCRLNADLWAMRHNEEKPVDYVMLKAGIPYSDVKESRLRKKIVSGEVSYWGASEEEHSRMFEMSIWPDKARSFAGTGRFLRGSLERECLELLFTLHEYGNLYKKYKDEIEKLSNQYNALSIYCGNVFLISIKAKHLPFVVVDGEKVRQALEHFDKTRELPDDRLLNPILAMTYDKGGMLNPQTAEDGLVKVDMVNVPNSSDDPAIREKYQRFNERYDELMSKMRKDIRASRDDLRLR